MTMPVIRLLNGVYFYNVDLVIQPTAGLQKKKCNRSLHLPNRALSIRSNILCGEYEMLLIYNMNENQY